MVRIDTDDLFLVNNILGPIDPGQWIKARVCKIENCNIKDENIERFKIVKQNAYEFIIKDIDLDLDDYMGNDQFNVSVLPRKGIASKPAIKILINGDVDNRIANTLYNDRYEMDKTCEIENGEIYYDVEIWRYKSIPIVKIFKEIPGYDHKDYLELAIESTLNLEDRIFDSLDENYRLVQSVMTATVSEHKDARITSWYYDIVDSLGDVIYDDNLNPVTYINEYFKYKIDMSSENVAILSICDNEENYTPLAELNINKIGVPHKILVYRSGAAKLTEEGYVYESCGYRYILEIDEAGIAYFGIEDIESGDLMLTSDQYHTVYCEDKISTEYMLQNDGAINYNLNRGRLVVEQVANNQFVGSPIHSKDFFIAHTFAGIPVRIF